MSSGPGVRLVAALASAACGAAAIRIGLSYPPGAAWGLAIVLLSASMVFLRPRSWLLFLPALLPVCGFATWTGWLIFEEFDLLVLASAAGGYAALAMRPSDRIAGSSTIGTFAIGSALICAFAASSLWALWQGHAAGNGASFGWFQGYHEPLNSLRVGKSFWMSLLMLPLLRRELRLDGERALNALSSGLAAGLGLACLAVLWERLAFTGLMDFSTDYRATAMFWEMHVGGAALDGFLALTLPFAIRELLRARSPIRFALHAALLGLAAYACLTTFSRGVYLAVPIALAVAWFLGARGRSRAELLQATGLRGRQLGALVLLGAAGATLAFAHGGYRSLIAFVGVSTVLLAGGPALRRLKTADWILGLVPGVAFGALGIVIAPLLEKGVYLQFGIAGMLGVGATLGFRYAGARLLAILSLATLAWLMFAWVTLAEFWGGSPAAVDILPVIGVLAALGIWNARAMEPLWPEGLRAQASLLGVVLLAGAVVVVFAAGPYMKGRFDTSQSDLAGRVQHWRESLGLLGGATDWIVGKGYGRYPGSYLFGVRDSAFPGTYQIESDAGRDVLALTGPRFTAGSGELFRVSQRVDPQPGTYVVSFEARSAREMALRVEFCTQHLLYPGVCADRGETIHPQGHTWQRYEVQLDGKELSRGAWYAPRLGLFSVAVDSFGQKIELANISMIGPDGTQVLLNGNFSDGMAHWFPISERIHLPWHIKSMPLNLLFEQGFVGLALFSLLVLTSGWRLVRERGTGGGAAPYVAASLVGFMVVGVFDSLLDVPRVSWIFFFLLLWSIMPVNTRRHVRTAYRKPPGPGISPAGFP